MTTATPSAAERRPADERSELLHGALDIAAYLGLTVRQVERHIAQSSLPVFRMGRTVCARRSSLDRWLAELDHAQTGLDSREPGPEHGGGRSRRSPRASVAGGDASGPRHQSAS